MELIITRRLQPSPGRRLIVFGAAAVASGFIYQIVGNFGPYARHGGPVLLRIGPNHGLHLADVGLLAVLLCASLLASAVLAPRGSR